ncbi:unnamed protein product [Clonostachys byssicola]|uniref:Uncharacterized protein n=1 Tax=Clonostachys byssicola TaxID=160290 RepID=A0A9N9ULZ7_9HYPO|nr:unnamed protein product [Clonostachys byssicola]
MEWTYISQTPLGGIYLIVFLLSLNLAFGIVVITHRALGCKLGGILSRLWWMRCSAVVLFTYEMSRIMIAHLLTFTCRWHVAFLVGVFADLYSPKYWNFDTITQQETRISNILLVEKLCYRQMIIGEVWFWVLCSSSLQTRNLRAAMLRLVPATIGICLRGWAEKAEQPDVSPSGIIWGSAFIMIQLFLAIHLRKPSSRDMRENEEDYVSACDLYDRAQFRRRNDSDRWIPSIRWKLFNTSHLWQG